MTLFVVRTEVVRAALADPECSVRLEKAKSLAEFQAVLVAYCKAKGYKAVEVPMK